MADSVSVSSHHSYGSRVGNSIKSILGGIILVIVSIILLVRNEKNYVEQKAALDEGASVVQEATADQINSELDGSEIHVSGQTASNDETLVDDIFGVVTDDLKLKRTVEMYQWYEDEDTECTDNYGGSEDCTTTYTYNTVWDTEAINSNDFYKSEGHENPTDREYRTNELVKSPITLGVYTLTTTFVDYLSNYASINLDEQNVTVPSKYQNTDTNDESAEVLTNNKFHIQNDYIYIGENPEEPAIGDLRITFSSVKPGTVSVVGKQKGKELTSYATSNGRSIALLEQGTVTAADMFQHAQDENKMITWILRFIGLLLMFSGFCAMLKFIETLAKVIPFLANIIGVGTGIIAFGLTLLVGFVTIGIAWLVVRPVVGICCLVVAAAGIFLLVWFKKNKKENNPEIKEGTPKISESK